MILIKLNFRIEAFFVRTYKAFIFVKHDNEWQPMDASCQVYRRFYDDQRFRL